jgi:hypothetical protein
MVKEVSVQIGETCGELEWDDVNYTAVLVDFDLVELRYEAKHGPTYMLFGSAEEEGFIDADDVMNQALDFLIDAGFAEDTEDYE